MVHTDPARWQTTLVRNESTRWAQNRNLVWELKWRFQPPRGVLEVLLFSSTLLAIYGLSAACLNDAAIAFLLPMTVGIRCV